MWRRAEILRVSFVELIREVTHTLTDSLIHSLMQKIFLNAYRHPTRVRRMRMRRDYNKDIFE